MKTSNQINAPRPTLGLLRRWAAASTGKTRSARGTPKTWNEGLSVSKKNRQHQNSLITDPAANPALEKLVFWEKRGQ